MSDNPKIFIVDDDEVVRHALTLLVETAGYIVHAFDSAEAFIEACGPESHGCLILDVQMPGMDGPTLQQELMQRGIMLPVIFLSAHGSIPLTVRTIKAGAMDFLTKPVEAKVLLERIRSALAVNLRFVEAERRLAALTEREREVMMLAVGGKSNKEVGRELDISPRTVEIHRARVMQKTGAANLLELAEIIKEIERWN
jgi:FixJ family two-component response regulator